MTIRFTCAECGSVLKIKDELAGSTGRCPKCKTKFVVPAPVSEEPEIKAEPQVEVELPSKKIEQQNHEPLPDLDPIPVEVPVDEHPPVQDVIARRIPVPADVLSLDDSNSDFDAFSDQEQPSETVPVHATDTDDDLEEDLDSPPMMVSAILRASESDSVPAESKSSEKSSNSAREEIKTSKRKTKPLAEKPFDPLEFLMSDRPEPRRESPVPDRRNNDAPDLSGTPDMIDALDLDDPPDLSLSMDSDDDFQARTTPLPLTRPTPAPPSRFTPEKVDLATAAKMMKKAIKDSQAETAQQREVNAKAGYDYGLFFREFGWRGFAILGGGVGLTLCLYFGANWMLGSSMKLPKLGWVTGTIKLDGQPLVGAEVYFTPIELEVAGWKKDRPRTSVGVTDAKGQFKMMYLPADRIEGVAAGRCRVWITHTGPKGNDIPAEWSEGAMVIKEVVGGSQKAPFDLDLASPKKR